MIKEGPRPQIAGILLIPPGADPETTDPIGKFPDSVSAAKAAENGSGEVEIWEERVSRDGPEYRQICTCS